MMIDDSADRIFSIKTNLTESIPVINVYIYIEVYLH